MARHDERGGRPRRPDRWQCYKCPGHDGIPSTDVVQIWHGPLYGRDGKMTGGLKRWVCLRCLMRGEITEAR